MRIVVLPPRGVVFSDDSPWRSLLNGLRSAGHDVADFGIGEGTYEALVALNDQPLVPEMQSRHSIGPSRSILIVLEPRVTAPRMYTKRALRRYEHRFAASPIWAEQIGGHAFRWPQDVGPQQMNQISADFAASMINGDKRSAVPGSLYGLRRSVIRESEDRGLPLAVFGPGWNASVRGRLGAGAKAAARALASGTPPRLGEAFSDLSQHPDFWLGTVVEKQVAFSSAPVAVIIENSADYVSEKLVDAIRGGAAPVYVGPPLSNFGFPEPIAVTCVPTADGVVQTVRNLTKTRIDEVVSAGENWLLSKGAKNHEIRNVLHELGEMIGQQLRLT